MDNSQSQDSGRQIKRTALGKGYTDLMGLSDDPKLDISTPAASVVVSQQQRANKPSGVVIRIKVEDIEPNPHQPRKIFDDEALISLSKSILEDGVIQPIIVSRAEAPGKFVMIAGERRWRATKMAGIETIPAIVKEASPEVSLRLALIENIQRADLNIIEEAEAYASLIRDFGLTQEQCAEKVGKDRTSVTNALRLLSLPKEIQDDLMESRLTMGHGRALLALEEQKAMLRARDIVIKKQLNVRRTEQLCKTLSTLTEEALEKQGVISSASADLEYLSEALRSHLRTRVRISGNDSKGKIEISYFSAAELERILGLIGIEGR